jgi:TPR repeat protein
MGYCGVVLQRKEFPACAAVSKPVCRKGDLSVAPVLTWEKFVLAEAAAQAPASLAAMAALPLLLFSNLHRNHDPPESYMRAWREAADSGHAEAQLLVGICFHRGLGVTKDEKAAADWIAKSAAQGCASALNILGDFFFYSGAGVSQDYKAAFVCYAKAAAQGNTKAQTVLGQCFQRGSGAAQDFTAAAEWYAKAAAKNNADAQYLLGRCFDSGSGVEQDDEAAAELYAKAAATGHSAAEFSIGLCYLEGSGVAKDFALAERWLRKAEAHGQAEACLYIFRISRERAAADAAAARPHG